MTSVLRVLTPGLWTLVVDAGRPRTRSLGVPVGGAADRLSLALGNALVGNPPDAVALEASFAGPVVEAGDGPLAVVVFGAPFDLHADRGPLSPGTTFTLRPGERLRLGGTGRGARAYLCVHGGLEAPVVLGSRSSLAPLRGGEAFPCVSAEVAGRFIRLGAHDEASTMRSRARCVLRVLPGNQADWFPPEALRGAIFTVSPASNRMGLRLEGAPLPVPAREMVSEPVRPGTVQVTREGLPIVLGVDGQTIGGYPKLAQVIAADRDRLGQLRPGDRVTFVAVDAGEAESAYRAQRRALADWLARLHATAEVRRIS